MMIHLFTLLAGILFFWLLGFLLQDIRTLEVPPYKLKVLQEIEEKGYPPLNEQLQSVNDSLKGLNSEIKARQEDQELRAKGAENLEQTIAQLRRLINTDPAQDPTQKARLSENLESFLALQKQYQEINNTLTSLTSARIEKERQRESLSKQLSTLDEKYRLEKVALEKWNRMRVATLQLVLLIPLLGVFLFFMTRKRGACFPIFLAFGCAALIRIILTMHEYFPARWFKYIWIVIALLAVVWLLVYLIRLAITPRPERLVLQYSQAYEKFFCPICEYPIRRGPLKYLYWNRKNIQTVLKGTGSSTLPETVDTPYTCPACGEQLFEKCEQCGKIRHSLLQYCEHCGAAMPQKEPHQTAPSPEGKKESK